MFDTTIERYAKSKKLFVKHLEKLMQEDYADDIKKAKLCMSIAKIYNNFQSRCDKLKLSINQEEYDVFLEVGDENFFDKYKLYQFKYLAKLKHSNKFCWIGHTNLVKICDYINKRDDKNFEFIVDEFGYDYSKMSMEDSENILKRFSARKLYGKTKKLNKNLNFEHFFDAYECGVDFNNKIVNAEIKTSGNVFQTLKKLSNDKKKYPAKKVKEKVHPEVNAIEHLKCLENILEIRNDFDYPKYGLPIYDDEIISSIKNIMPNLGRIIKDDRLAHDFSQTYWYS